MYFYAFSFLRLVYLLYVWVSKYLFLNLFIYNHVFAKVSESALTHEISSLKTTAARLKFKGIDGGLHKRWSMWFNSKQRAEPYQSLQYTGNNCYKLSFGIQALHGCRQFVA